MTLETLLLNLGLNVAANYIYDLLTSYGRESTAPTVEGLQEYLVSHLKVDGASVKAEKLIEFLAQKGNISIINSSVHAAKQVSMGSAPGTVCVFGHNSRSSTDKTAIEASHDAAIKMQGGAKIVQNEDGSISFLA